MNWIPSSSTQKNGKPSRGRTKRNGHSGSPIRWSDSLTKLLGFQNPRFFELPIIRVNKAVEKLALLVAKSRLIIPGHLDPEIGTYRTDSPTAATMTTRLTRLVKILAAPRGYHIYSFDVSTAFLSGKATEREIYLRAPTTRLPRVGKHRAIRPLELMQVLKSAHQLTESPPLVVLGGQGWHGRCGIERIGRVQKCFPCFRWRPDLGHLCPSCRRRSSM